MTQGEWGNSPKHTECKEVSFRTWVGTRDSSAHRQRHGVSRWKAEQRALHTGIHYVKRGKHVCWAEHDLLNE